MRISDGTLSINLQYFLDSCEENSSRSSSHQRISLEYEKAAWAEAVGDPFLNHVLEVQEKKALNTK